VSGYNGSQMSNGEPQRPPEATDSYVAPLGPPTPEVSATPASTPGGRVVSCILALIVGAVFGAVGTVAHQSTLNLGTVRLPLGLPLALLGVLALLIGFRLLLRDRLVVFLAAVGVVAVIALFSVPSPGGSVLIPQGLAGILWTIGPVLIATVVVAWPRLPERGTARQPTAAEA
jgi:peptidoglycan/LPS O-acetylase OafA/YrhL